MTRDLVVRNIGRLITPAGPAPRLGPALGTVREIETAALVAQDGRITYVGPESLLRPDDIPPASPILDAGGAVVLPGFVDAHTHLAYAGDRDGEIRQRLAGATYKEIAAAGGGIVRTVAATRAADRDTLASLLRARLDEMLRCGTTSAEVKSGYGLETAAEIRSLEAIRGAADHPVTLVPTFLGAHEVPPEHRERRERYVDPRERDDPEVARAARHLRTSSARRACSRWRRAAASWRPRARPGSRCAFTRTSWPGRAARSWRALWARAPRTISSSCPTRACPLWPRPAARPRSCPPPRSTCGWGDTRPRARS